MPTRRSSQESRLIRYLLVTRFGSVGYAPRGMWAVIARDFAIDPMRVAHIARDLGIATRTEEQIPLCERWVINFLPVKLRRQ